MPERCDSFEVAFHWCSSSLLHQHAAFISSVWTGSAYYRGEATASFCKTRS